MTHSVTARRLIQEFEGFCPTPYKDQGGVLTIGYGHTSGVRRGDRCDLKQAEQWLDDDLEIVEGCIGRNVKAPLNQNQYDAICSFIFNLGISNFVQSTLLKQINAGDYAAAAAEFPRWTKIWHKDDRTYIQPTGLIRRRAAEQALFLKEWA